MNELQKSFIDNTISFLCHYNHNHDKLGRFAKSANSFVNGSPGYQQANKTVDFASKMKLGKDGWQGEFKFGDSKKTPVYADTVEDINTLSEIYNNQNEHLSKIYDATTEGLYNYRIDELKDVSKEDYRKNIKIRQITASKGEAHDCSIWATYDDGKREEFGEWYMLYDSKKKKIVDSQFYN